MYLRALPLQLTVFTASLSAALACWAQQPAGAAAAAGRDTPATATAEAKSDKPAEAPMAVVQVRGARSSYDPRRDDTASKMIVTAEELTKYGDTSVLDVLKRVPGITVDGGGSGAIRMRGLSGNYTQILIN